MSPADSSKRGETSQRRYLAFIVAQRLYALPTELVFEVIRIPPRAHVPEAPKALLGLVNLRGAVLPLVSLRILLGLDETEATETSRAIVFDNAAPVALLADAIVSLVSVDAAHITTRASILCAEAGEQLKGAFQHLALDRVAKILDVPPLLDRAFAQAARPVRQTAKFEATQRRADETVRALSSEVGAGSREENASKQGNLESFRFHLNRNDSSKSSALVTFDVSDQEFALNLEAVQEIIPMPDGVADLPGADTVVLGVVEFRDELLPLLSLRALLGFSAARALNTREKVVITYIGGAKVGLVADRAREIIYAEAAKISPVPPALAARMGGEARTKAIYQGGVGRRPVSILAPEQLFSKDIMQRLQSTQAAQAQSKPEVRRRGTQVPRVSAGKRRIWLCRLTLSSKWRAFPKKSLGRQRRRNF